LYFYILCIIKLLLMQTLSQILELIQKYAEQENLIREPRNLYEPIQYILQLGGKRLRPALVLMSYNLYEEDTKAVLPAGFAIEVFHNFTLMHDDIMDNAPLRRGMATVHEKYNINTGILSGDVMLILAYKYLMSVSADSNTTLKILECFNKCAIEVCEGQQLDIDFETRNDVTISEYLRMIELKTSVLLAAALEIGAILGKTSESDAKNLYDFGKNIGIAFQLQDDILDTFGNPATFGKKVGGDISQNKKTFLYLKALEITDSTNKKALLDWFSVATTSNNEAEKINSIKSIFLNSGVLDAAQAMQNEYYTIAMQYLDAVSVNAEKKQILRSFAEELLTRNV
jgi:geranylgeranyl diphosphate synthase, type II